jgi:hypothetical protein
MAQARVIRRGEDMFSARWGDSLCHLGGSAMKLICSIALALAILIRPTSSRADVVISGAGSVSCGKIAEDYRKIPSDVEIWVMHWAQGFMSGANINQ